MVIHSSVHLLSTKSTRQSTKSVDMPSRLHALSFAVMYAPRTLITLPSFPALCKPARKVSSFTFIFIPYISFHSISYHIKSWCPLSFICLAFTFSHLLKRVSAAQLCHCNHCDRTLFDFLAMMAVTTRHSPVSAPVA